MNKTTSKRLLKGLHNKVFDRPLLITQQALAPIVDYMINPERGSFKASDDVVKTPLKADFGDNISYQKALAKYYNVDLENKIGYLTIDGTLVNRAGQVEACVELTSYESLVSTFQEQVNLGINTCVMNFDSGGGEAYRCFGSAMAVRNIADQNGVKLIAYVDGLSASASYAWTCVADEVIANPLAQVGSIGVVVQLYNDSEYLKNLGVERSFVFAGDNKIPFDTDGQFTEDFISSLQSRVDKTYNSFVNHVASNRNLSTDQVKNTKASVFDADDALQVGLVDKVMELEEFNDYILGNPTNDNSVTTITETEKDMEELKLQQLTEKLDAKQEEFSKLQASYDALNEKLTQEVIAKEKAEQALAEYKKEQALSARKQKLEAIFGTESAKVGEYATMFASLDDKAFETFTSELSNRKEVEKEKMKEVGHDKQDKPLKVDQKASLAEQAKQRGNKYKKQGE
jgi:signal peptide peptidase SppA